MSSLPPLLLAALALGSALSLRADPLATGPGQLECPNGDEPITLFTYKPPNYTDGPLLVVCHGVQRNAEDYRDFAITLAERYGVIVVAPLFDEDRFPSSRYQRVGLLDTDGNAQPPEAWTCAIIPKIVAHVRELEGRPELPYYLIGHSAGAQFLVRLAAFMPGDAVRIVADNPGSNLFPDREQKFGYGFGDLPDDLSNDDVMRHYLAAPLTLNLGTDDSTSESYFDASPDAMKQGPNRLERGRACFQAAQKLAQEHDWDLNWRIVETPGIGHEAALMFAADEAGDALFGQ
jgi:pimeloyl-ACP methyl ester carboxylesterase